MQMRCVIAKTVKDDRETIDLNPAEENPETDKTAMTRPSDDVCPLPAPAEAPVPPADRSWKQAEILVVDDTAANLQLLSEILEKAGHLPRLVNNGKAAVASISQRLPHLILLDARMPDMDGFEVCAMIKADPLTRHIPVIFISAFSGNGDRVRAFQAGCVDYVAKPFQVDEVLARVNAHLKINQLQTELAGHNLDLEKQVATRTRELTEAHRKLTILDQAKSDFLALIAHELRTPLNGLFGSADLAFSKIQNDPWSAELKSMFEVSRGRIIELIDHAQLLTSMQVSGGDFARNVCQLDDLLKAARDESAAIEWPEKINFTQTPVGLGQVVGDAEFLKQALLCLIQTAAKFTTGHGRVEIGGCGLSDSVVLTIESSGRVIPEAALGRFFEVMALHDAALENLGLAPAVAERIISLLGGQVQVVNLKPNGIRFHIWLLRHPGVNGQPRPPVIFPNPAGMPDSIC